jgi:cytochrome c-type biogenesis protein CcmE
MIRKRRRLYAVIVGMVIVAAGIGLILYNLSEGMRLFIAPSELAKAPHDRPFRLGGLVEAGSLKREADGATVHFRITDKTTAVPVSYRGVLPDLFREGQGVVAEGRLGPDGGFVADEVLAKHDEKYMPREVVEALKKAGRWQEGATP